MTTNTEKRITALREWDNAPTCLSLFSEFVMSPGVSRPLKRSCNLERYLGVSRFSSDHRAVRRESPHCIENDISIISENYVWHQVLKAGKRPRHRGTNYPLALGIDGTRDTSKVYRSALRLCRETLCLIRDDFEGGKTYTIPGAPRRALGEAPNVSIHCQKGRACRVLTSGPSSPSGTGHALSERAVSN